MPERDFIVRSGVTANSVTVVGAVVANGTVGSNAQVLTSNGTVSYWNTLPPVLGANGTTASGSVTLTNASPGAQSLTPTNWGQFVRLPNATTMSMGAIVFSVRNAGTYTMKIYDNGNNVLGFIESGKTVGIGLASNTTANGEWTTLGAGFHGVTSVYNSFGSSLLGYNVKQHIALDNNRILFLFNTNPASGIVFDESTNTWGDPTAVFTNTSIVIAYPYMNLLTPNTVLVTAEPGTSIPRVFSATVATISGTTITPGTHFTKDLVANTTGIDEGSGNKYGFATHVEKVGSTYIRSYATSNAGGGGPTSNTIYSAKLLPMTVSGSNVTIGSETTFLSANSNLTVAGKLYPFFFGAVNSTVLLAAGAWANGGAAPQLSFTPYTVSGANLTAGTPATTSNTIGYYFNMSLVSAGARYVAIYPYADTILASAVNISSGPTVTLNTVNTLLLSNTSTSTQTKNFDYVNDGSKIMVVSIATNTSSQMGNSVNIITDTNGVLSVGTPISSFDTNMSQDATMIRLSEPAGDNTAYLFEEYYATNNPGAAAVNIRKLDYSGSSPLLKSGGVLSYSHSDGGVYAAWGLDIGYGSSFGYRNLDGKTDGYYSQLIRSNTSFVIQAYAQNNNIPPNIAKFTNGVFTLYSDGPRVSSYTIDPYVAGATSNTLSYYYFYNSGTSMLNANDYITMIRIETVTKL